MTKKDEDSKVLVDVKKALAQATGNLKIMTLDIPEVVKSITTPTTKIEMAKEFDKFKKEMVELFS